MRNAECTFFLSTALPVSEVRGTAGESNASVEVRTVVVYVGLYRRAS